jgi:type IX secretion system PorP/SprF family membrane protein
MKILRLSLRAVTGLVLLLSFGHTQAQDIHFTLHRMTPVAFNPATTGGFYGSYRISALYRDQYRSVAGNAGYKTPTFSVDAPILKGFKKTDWLGVGIFFYSDKSGTGSLTQSAFKVSAAYHLALNKKGTSTLAIGYQTGSIQREIKDPQKLIFEDQLLGQMSGGMLPQTMEQLEMDKKGFLDHVGGLKFTSKYNKTDEFFIGLSAGKFGKPDWSLVAQGGQYQVDPRAYGEIGMSTVLSNKVRFSPNITYQKIMGSAASSLVVQGILDLNYDPEKEIVLRGGLGYRSGANIGDAIQLMLGADIQDIRVMLGYDINISSLTSASGSFGAFELAAQYIGKIYKRPNPDPIIFCPRF